MMLTLITIAHLVVFLNGDVLKLQHLNAMWASSLLKPRLEPCSYSFTCTKLTMWVHIRDQAWQLGVYRADLGPVKIWPPHSTDTSLSKKGPYPQYAVASVCVRWLQTDDTRCLTISTTHLRWRQIHCGQG